MTRSSAALLLEQRLDAEGVEVLYAELSPKTQSQRV